VIINESAADNAALFLFRIFNKTTFMAGYSETPLIKKLGIKSGSSIFVHQAPEAYFDWLGPLPNKVTIKKKVTGQLDFIHLFVKDEKSFHQAFVKAQKVLKKDGMLWVSWPKKSSGVVTDLDENVIRNFGLQEGLVDVKVCAVDDVWSGLKFVVRVKDR
jgi:hypothetical protein